VAAVSLTWTWLAAPYFVVTLVLVAIGVVAALTRGDRVLRIGVLGAVAAAVPWGLASGFAACLTSPAAVERLLRLGNGPLSLIGPTILLVLFGASGQLERHRWIARTAGVLGMLSMVMAWSTPWVIAGTHVTGSGLRYVTGGPLLGLHLGMIGVWLAIGLFIARRTTPGDRRVRQARLVAAIAALSVAGTADWLLAYDVAGYYPLAPELAFVAALIALHLVARTDLLRPRGLDLGVAMEAGAFATTAGLVAGLALVLDGASPLLLVSVGAAAWVTASGIAWAIARRRPTRVRGQRRLDQFQSELTEISDEAALIGKLGALWHDTLTLGAATLWLRVVDGLEKVEPGRVPALRTLDAPRWTLAPDVERWLVTHPEPLTVGDLSTMRLGALRQPLVAVATAHGAPLIVPLIDRAALVGLVEVERREGRVLREDERGLVVVSAEAAARALTYLGLTRAAAKAGAAAREVEVAEAMRTAATRRDDALGRWSVMVEYRPGPRTSGAAWSTMLLADGRLAVLVLEGEARGVPAALATAALIGAFAAATVGVAAVELDDLVAALRGSVAVGRGAEPIAAFVALLDHAAGTIAWACAGHPGALVVIGDEPRALAGAGAPLPATDGEIARGEAALPGDGVIVIGSPGVRRGHGAGWPALVAGLVGSTGTRLAAGIVDSAARARVGRLSADEDLLAVVIRHRADG
jgi:hypothetical protein